MAETLRGIARRKGAVSAAQRATNILFWGGIALLASGGAARAQVVENVTSAGPESKNIAIRLGAYLPTESDARNYGGRQLPGIQVDYKVQIVPLQNSVGAVSVGYIERNNLRIIPILLNQTWREPGRTIFGQEYYYGLGAGLYSVRMSTPDTDGKPKALFGFNIHAGLDFNNSFFGDVTYHHIYKYNNKFVGGFMFSLGARL